MLLLFVWDIKEEVKQIGNQLNIFDDWLWNVFKLTSIIIANHLTTHRKKINKNKNDYREWVSEWEEEINQN